MPIKGRFKSYFFRGLAVLLPTILTLWILWWGYNFIQDNIGNHIKKGLQWAIVSATGREFFDRHFERPWIDISLSVAGFLVALLAVCIVGALLASVVGKTVWRRIEKFLMSTPLLKHVYPYVKQVTDFLIAHQDKEKMFSRVVAVEYPRKGIWSLGLVTGAGIKRLVDSMEKEFLTLLVPTAPTPFTGFIIMVPKEQTIDLDIAIDEALRFILSAGVIAPGSRAAFALPQPRPEYAKGAVKNED